MHVLGEPTRVVGYGGPEIDIALTRGEVDLRANGADAIFQGNRDGADKGRSFFTPRSRLPRVIFLRATQTTKSLYLSRPLL